MLRVGVTEVLIGAVHCCKSVFVCVCVCVYMRKREGDRKGEGGESESYCKSLGFTESAK